MRSRRPLAGVLCVLLVTLHAATPSGQRSANTNATGAASAADDDGDGFTLAVVRRDAIVLPIATYDGKRWKNAWPRPQSKVTAPIGLVDVPARWWSGRKPAPRWTFWPIRGASQEIETVGPAWYPTYCSQGVGLRTTYAPSAPPPPVHVRPYPKDGLAVVGTAAIAPIEILDAATAPIARELETSLAPQVFDEEAKYLKSLARANWRHPYDEEERKATPIKVEAVYRVARGQGDRDVYYFEGFKHYAVRMPPQDSARRRSDPPASVATKPLVVPACDLVTFVSGFFMRRAEDKGVEAKASEKSEKPAKIEPINLQVTPTSCDFENALILLPLGTVTVRDRTLWVVQWSGRRNEFYTVLDIEGDQLRQVAWAGGGGCQGEE